jgi:dipeptidyl aminopeptidase/acylaminoacyl peptidase
MNWIEGTNRFWFQKSVRGGKEFELVDAEALTKNPAFDHQKLARALSAASGRQYGALALPFSEIRFVEGQRSIRFSIEESGWQCNVVEYTCRKTEQARPQGPSARRRAPEDEPDSPAEFENDVHDGMVDLSPQTGDRTMPASTPEPRSSPSPDGKTEAIIQNFNVWVRTTGTRNATPLSRDGSEGNYYTLASIRWSPDSRRLVAYRIRPGFKREVHYVESSPADQLQPKHFVREYAKPGDALDIAQPVLFDVSERKQVNIENGLFPNPYSLSRAAWWKDGRAFTFEYNQRGHQVYRVIEVDASTGSARALINEQSNTFIDYRPLIPNPRDTGKKVRHDVDDGREIIWMSERDGWAHLYLYDGSAGKVKNQITKGAWVVRSIDKVDEQKRQIWFHASGMYPGKNPYFTHSYRINFDGSGLTCFTEADANHTVVFSQEMNYYVDTWSTADQPKVAELRRTSDKKLILPLEHEEIDELLAAGWRKPETFTALGRDGKTDIWGMIYRPPNLDPAKKYPVVESIYAGPQGSFVPQTFSAVAQPLTELGFIVVQIDGMGTNNRSKSFHDTAWRNLADAGFTDRILWHKAVAAKYPYYDISRVGIFGNSAGGQNALAALLFHPEFYKAAVSNSGCHDNRMDKIWWNELWMGWPLGPQYEASSNVVNANRLQGKLLLIAGELDSNVDPSSTLQVVNALIKANRKFDLLYVPGGGHGAGGDFGRRMLFDFFIHNLQGLEPPDWGGQASE